MAILGKMDKVAAVYVTLEDGTRARGTGYGISSECVITARHLVCSQEGKRTKLIQIIWESTQTVREADLITEVADSLDPKLDVVLLRCDVPKAVCHSGSIQRDNPQKSLGWQSRGYARVGEERVVKVESSSFELREPTPMQGRLFEASRQDDMLVLGAEGKVDVPDKWRGVSGAPVFMDGGHTLLGLLIECPSGFEAGRICATPMWRLMCEKAFVDALGLNERNAKLEELKEDLFDLLEQKTDVCELMSKKFDVAGVDAEKLADYLIESVPLDVLISECCRQSDQLDKKGRHHDANTLQEVMLHLLSLRVDPLILKRVNGETSAMLSLDIGTRTAAAVVMAAKDGRSVAFRAKDTDTEPTGVCYIDNPLPHDHRQVKNRVAIFKQELINRFGAKKRMIPGEKSDDETLRRLTVNWLESEVRAGRTYYFLYVLPEGEDDQNEDIEMFEQVKGLFEPIVFINITGSREHEESIYHPIYKRYCREA